MKKVKQLLVFSFLMALCSISHEIMAQDRFTEQEKQEAINRFNEFQEELNLSNQQKPVVKEINKKYFEKLSHLKNDNTSKFKKFRAYKKLKSHRNKEMKNILTKDQYKIFKEFIKENKQIAKQKRKDKS